MKNDYKKGEKLAVSSSLNAVIKKLKKIRRKVVEFDNMTKHVRCIDKNMSDLTSLRRELEKDE
tara:strand:- start:40 stop:228 length:189 start_codon:yes stop_codon:yes gene_type:complete